jgi:hypothetical protein
MSNGGIIDASTGIANSIGRYFSIISVIPSSLYIIFVYLLAASGALHHSPDWSRAFTSVAHLDLAGIALLSLLSIALGVFIHPIQFAIVQFFEGYWGTRSIAQVVRYRRIVRYQQLCRKLNKSIRSVNYKLDKTGSDITRTCRARLLSKLDEASHIRATFPDDLAQVMPTRLGNVLRRAESQVGSQYGLDALQAVPHLMLIAPASHVDYVNDQRSQLDLAVRMTFISVIATATAILFLCRDGYWVLIALVPYVLAYLSYRGSVVAAGHYGSALDTLVNLDRFALYQQLHLPLPATTHEERKTNAKLGQLFDYSPKEAIEYSHPTASDGDGAEPASG